MPAAAGSTTRRQTQSCRDSLFFPRPPTRPIHRFAPPLAHPQMYEHLPELPVILSRAGSAPGWPAPPEGGSGRVATRIVSL